MKFMHSIFAGIAILAFTGPVLAVAESQQNALNSNLAQPKVVQPAQTQAKNANVQGTENLETSTNDASALVNLVNVNVADQKTLESLKGVGKVKARAIIAYREQNGSFENFEDLLKVKGITQTIINANKQRLTF